MKLAHGLLLLFIPVAASAHVGSPDVYVEGNAGPYKLLITVRTPLVIPGTEEIEVRSEAAGVESISAVPLPMSGAGAKFPPIPEKLKRSSADAQFFSGSVWMMAPGSWQIRLNAAGDKGQGVLAVPIPAAAQGTKKMEPGLTALLSGLLAFLVLGVVSMVGAAVREAKLAPGVMPDRKANAAGWKATAVAAIVVVGAVVGGKLWWNSEEAAYANDIYKPMQMTAVVRGPLLTLKLHDPGWLNGVPKFRALPVSRSVDDLVLDHDHLMHLYVLREPGLDLVYHLHPENVAPGVFDLQLPSMPGGDYKLYADIVHSSGFPETLVAAVSVPAMAGRALSGDDAEGVATAWQQAPANSRDFLLPDGYHMRWIAAPTVLRAKQTLQFEFALDDPAGHAPKDMAFYMGMLGHAAFVKTDGTVFAHIHPNGTVAMAAFMQAQQQVTGDASASMADMPGMDMSRQASGGLPNVVSFPYGFPSPGRYRIYVQMKHGGTVETGVFDASVS